ncbi:MAG: transcriptional repressor LexA [Clostridia bacterium]|nr:transcriptional repressor LexA [Clostridia bacterium]
MRHRDPEKMRQLISFIDDFYDAYHRTPSTREISEHIDMTKSSVYNYLEALRNEGVIDFDGKMIVTESINKEISGYNKTGVIGSVPCGQTALEEARVEEYINLPVSVFGGGDLYLLHAYGDSMTGAGIDPGDLVVVRKRSYAENGDLVIAYVEGEGNTLKRYYRDEKNKRVILHPENKKYTDIVVKDCVIQGVVMNIIKYTDAARRA